MTLPDYRAPILALLPPTAFLKRDRNCALFVTDAPARCANVRTLLDRLGEAGYHAWLDGALIRMVPGPRLIQALERAHPAPPDAFCESLLRFAGREIDPTVPVLFAQGLLCVHGSAAQGDKYDRALRKSAALALRLGGGGGLYACALVRSALRTSAAEAALK